MDIDINQRNYDNYEDISGKPHKRVVLSDSSGNLVSPATSEKQDSILAELQQKTEPTDIQLAELIPVLRSLILAIANPSYVDKSANAIRNQVQSGTVTTVTTLTNLNSFNADFINRQANMAAWATNIRSLIT